MILSKVVEGLKETERRQRLVKDTEPCYKEKSEFPADYKCSPHMEEEFTAGRPGSGVGEYSNGGGVLGGPS